MSLDEEDPFDAFGSESDEDENENPGKAPGNSSADSAARGSVSQLLVQAANEKLASNKSTGKIIIHDSKVTQQPNQEAVDLSYLKRLELMTWPPPLYQGPILLVEELPVGGGRGYVATETIPSGTLVLVEEPMMTWPEEQLGKQLSLVSVKHLLVHDDVMNLILQFEEFHPTKHQVDSVMESNEECDCDEVTTEQIVKMIKSLGSEMTPRIEIDDNDNSANPLDSKATNMDTDPEAVTELLLLAEQRGVRCRNGAPLTENDIFRLLLALRYNGLESGIYRHVAMLNHDDYPNCAKFLPDNAQSFSEVRSTRPIHAGETLTISYLPRIMSHSSRRRHLWDQHRFDIGTSHLKGMKYKMELVGPNRSLPASPLVGRDGNSVTSRIEKASEELDAMQSEIAAEIESLGDFETAKALELSLLEMYNRSVEELQNEEHILVIPILSLHIDACALVLKDPGLTRAVQLGVLARQTLSIYRLLPLQEALLGPDHFDLARTNLDLANAVSELLSRSAKHLYELNLPSMNTFASWSSLESKARQEHDRVKQLYPHDAAHILAKIGSN